MSNVSQQPYIASSQSSQNQPMQLPIRNQSRFSSNPSLNHGSPTSNVTNSPKQQLTVVCPSSSNQNLNQQLSSSSSSSKSPVAIRSRSPSVQNQGKQNRYSLSTSNQNFVDQEQYESESSSKKISNIPNIPSSTSNSSHCSLKIRSITYKQHEQQWRSTRRCVSTNISLHNVY